MTKSKAYTVLFSMMFISILSMAGIALPYPILAPLFIDTALTEFNHFMQVPPKILLAIVLTTYPLGALLGSVFLGALSDVYGRKKTLAGSISLSALGYIFSGVALLKQDYLLFVLARFITGAFSGNVSIARAIAADLHPIIDKTRAFSWTYAAGYFGWLIGPLAGGYLMLLGAHTAFLVAAIVLFLAAGLTLILIADTNSSNIVKPQFVQMIWKHNSLRLLHVASLRRVFLIALIVNLGLNAFYEFYPVWLVEEFTFNSVKIGHYTALLTLCMILSSSMLIETVRTQFGKFNSIFTSLTLTAVLLCTTPFVDYQMLLGFFILMGVFIAFFNSLIPVYFSDRYADHGQGKLMGLLTMTFYLANAVIALIGGVVSLLGAVWSLVLGGLILFIGAMALYHFDRTVPNITTKVTT